MFNRTRDGKRYQKPQQKVPFAEWTDIHDRAVFAKYFLKNENSIYKVILSDLKEAENMILENRIREVHEEHTLSDVLKKTFVTPRKIQVDEVVGQIKYIRGLVSEIKSWYDFELELVKLEGQGKITIERSTEKHESK